MGGRSRGIVSTPRKVGVSVRWRGVAGDERTGRVRLERVLLLLFGAELGVGGEGASGVELEVGELESGDSEGARSQWCGAQAYEDWSAEHQIGRAHV